MSPRKIAALLALAALSLSGCSNLVDGPVVTVTSTVPAGDAAQNQQSQPAPAPADQQGNEASASNDGGSSNGDNGGNGGNGGDRNAKARSAYEAVLNDPNLAPVNPAVDYEPSGTYSYAMADVTGDGFPEMIYKVDVTDYFAPVMVVSEDGTVTEDAVLAGAGSAGGGRYRVGAAADGNGIIEVSGQSIDPTHEGKRFVVSGKSLTQTESFPVQAVGSDARILDLTWTPSTDHSALMAALP